MSSALLNRGPTLLIVWEKVCSIQYTKGPHFYCKSKLLNLKKLIFSPLFHIKIFTWYLTNVFRGFDRSVSRNILLFLSTREVTLPSQVRSRCSLQCCSWDKWPMWAIFGTGPTTSRRWGWFERRNTLWPPRQCQCTKSQPGPEIKILFLSYEGLFIVGSMCLPIWVCEHQRISVSRPSSVPAVYRREPERPSHLPGNLHYPCTPSSWRSPCWRTMWSMLGQTPNLEDKTKASSNSEKWKPVNVTVTVSTCRRYIRKTHSRTPVSKYS